MTPVTRSGPKSPPTYPVPASHKPHSSAPSLPNSSPKNASSSQNNSTHSVATKVPTKATRVQSSTPVMSTLSDCELRMAGRSRHTDWRWKECGRMGLRSRRLDRAREDCSPVRVSPGMLIIWAVMCFRMGGWGRGDRM